MLHPRNEVVHECQEPKGPIARMLGDDPEFARTGKVLTISQIVGRGDFHLVFSPGGQVAEGDVEMQMDGGRRWPGGLHGGLGQVDPDIRVGQHPRGAGCAGGSKLSAVGVEQA